MDADSIYGMISVERIGLAELLDGLTEEQWATPSLCTGWRVREVAAHLVMPFSISLPGLLVRLARARFDFDRVADEWARAERRPNGELARVLRANAGHRFHPPGLGPEAPLTDVLAHGEDIARPLGIGRDIPAAHAAVALDFLVSPKATRGFLPKGLVDGLGLEAVDIGWRHGGGATVFGTAAALLLALLGRSLPEGEISGDGVAILRSRWTG
jgi:uncharacterized protein (TIGR03083 family)